MLCLHAQLGREKESKGVCQLKCVLLQGLHKKGHSRRFVASPVAQAELVSLPHQCCGVMGAWKGMNLALGFIREHQGNGAEPEAGAVCRWTDHSRHLCSWGFAGGEA